MKTDREKSGLRGPVRSVQTRTVRLANAEHSVLEEPQSSHTIFYDSLGRKVEINQTYHTTKGIQTYKFVFTYDEAGTLARQEFYKENRLVSTDTFSEGRPSEEFQYHADGSSHGSLMEGKLINYDDEGHRIVEELLPAMARTSSFGIDVFNAKGDKASVSAEGAYRMRSVYDDRGNPLEIAFYSEDATLLNRYVFYNDAEGNLVKMEQYIEGALLLVTNYVYASGKLLEQSLYCAGVLERRQVYRYDESGEKSEEAEYSAHGSLKYKQSYSREFDANGNWTKETVTWWLDVKGAAPIVTVTDRTITYY